MTVGGGRVGALWIGGLEPYMDDAFLQAAMNIMGEPNVVSIKVMTNKSTGEPAGYGFINFDSDQTAIVAMHRLGGKIIPNSNPPIRFKLNHNSTRLAPGEIDTSIWVGDLTPEVDDFALYRFFTGRYTSVKCAKVVLDESGFSKGYGFVRFGLENEQQHALGNITGELGLGSKPIKVSMANQKNRSEQMNGLGGGITALSGVGALSLGGAGSPPPLTGGAGGTWGGITTWPGPSTSPWPPQNHGGAANGHHQPTAMTSWAPGLAASPLSAAAAALTGPLSGAGAGLSGPLSGQLNNGISGILGGLGGGIPGGLGGAGPGLSMPGPVSSPSPAQAPPTAPSPGPDFQYHPFYQQQLAAQQQQQLAAWQSAWQHQQQRL